MTTFTPSMSNSLSCGPFSVSNSSRYDMPEQPPPFTPIRRNAVSGRFCWALSSFTCFVAFSESATAMIPSSRLFRCRRDVIRRALFLVVRERRLDGVLGQHRAVDLHRWQLELVHDVRILDLGRLVHALALQPLGGQARGGDGAATSEGLELGVLDDASLEVHPDLELHDVAALRRAHEARAHARRVLREGPDVTRI